MSVGTIVKASELRIGNYIKAKSPEKAEWVEKHKVSAHLIYSLEHPNAMDFVKPDVLPIPLTEEWLLRFGFYKIGSNYEKDWLLLHGNKNTGTFDFLLNEPHSGKYKATILRYVHQLQNLYCALTGEELNVRLENNFKEITHQENEQPNT